MNKVLYIAGPIDGVAAHIPGVDDGGPGGPGELQAGWQGALAARRAAIKSAGREAGWTCYDPWAGWVVKPDTVPNKTIWWTNNMALNQCDALIAIWPNGVSTIGTWMEVEKVRDSGRPVVVMTDNTNSWSLEAPGITKVSWWADPAEVIEQISGLVSSGRRRAGTQVGVKVDPGGIIPIRHHTGDAGWDLFVSENCHIRPGEFKDVPCKVSVEFPEGIWGMITGRSSTLRKKQLLVAQGIIDQGYRGELFCGVWNLGQRDTLVAEGERLAQLIPLPVMADNLTLKEVDKLTEHTRGDNGFGSTGD